MMKRHAIASAVLASLSTVALLGQALAQTSGSEQRVEITGSSIKRIASEGALPLQVFSREDLERAGVTSAEQLVARLASSGNGLDNMVSLQGGDFFSGNSGNRQHNNGAAGVSLRGLGAQYTLVLLNGRRVATHGLNGQSVDLNQIPVAAIEKVEILKDGASAIYGTDAIGGVMNFILRKDFSGLEAGVFVDQTQHGGGNIARASVVFGTGTLSTDGFNFTGSLAYKTNSRLRGSQRTSFHNGNQPGLGMTEDTIGAPYAPIRVAAGTALPANAPSTRVTFPGDTQGYNAINPLSLAGKCETGENMSQYRSDITGIFTRGKACTWDYGGQWSLMQPVDALNFVGKGTVQLNKDHTVFVEATASQVKSSTEYTPIQVTFALPTSSPYYQNLATLFPTLFRPTNTSLTDSRVFFNSALAERVTWRCVSCGPRQQDTNTDAYRILIGLEGVLNGWDYKAGLSSGNSKAKTNLGDGNMFVDKLGVALATGRINPFLLAGQTQTAEAQALIDDAKARGSSLYGGRTSVQELDATFTREVFALPGGMASVAVGLDLRKETYTFDSSSAATANINGTSAPAGLPEASRRITAVFGEVVLPVVKDVELSVAVRHDRYSDFGATTNPKAGLLWRASPALAVRGSYSRGFHAPDFDSLYGGATFTAFNTDINDPLLCPGGVARAGNTTGEGCGIRPLIGATSNKDLKPERSKQFSIGFVVQPVENFSATADYWKIDLTDRIGSLTGLAVVANYAQYSQFVIRTPAGTGPITAIQSPALNLAGDQTSGVDINLNARFKTGIGKITANLDGTYVSSYKSRFSTADAWSERVGVFGDSTYGYDLHLRWKHTASVSWSDGPWSATFSQQHSTGYQDEVNGYSADPAIVLSTKGFQSKVKAYTLYDLSASWTGMKNLTVTAGIKNLFDTKPSFSYHNVDNVAGAGWDGRVGQPRLRAFTLGANYKFF